MPSTPPRSPLAGRVFSLLSLAADNWHRARYRRAELRRIPAAGRQGAASPQWDLSQPRLPVLSCAVGSAVTYDVTLSPGASIETRCALRTAAAHVSVAFTIDVEVAGQRWTATQVVTSAPRSWQRRSRALRLTVPAGGAATIVLSTKAAGSAADDAVAAWINPRVVTPRPMSELYAAVRSVAAGRFTRGTVSGERLYQLWVREQEPSAQALREQREWSDGQSRLFTLITDVANPASWRGGATAKSVLTQSYARWEWLLVVPEEAAFAAPLSGDPRVRRIVVPGGTSRAEAWMRALQEARGQMACLLAEGDTLSPSALYEVAAVCDRHGESDLVYSDEDQLDAGGARRSPRFKPSWSPDLLLACNYVGRLAMLRVESALAAGGFRQGFDGAEEWDLLLRLSRTSPDVRRLPQCLYHRRTVTSSEPPASTEAVRDHLLALGLPPATVRSEGRDRVTWPLHGDPLVSVIIPNRNAPDVVRTCVEGLLKHTPSPRREIVIVDNGSTDPAVLELYREIERDGAGRVVPFDRPFNYSAACNAGAAAATGDYFLFLNNDIEIIEPGWLDELVRWAQRPDVGIVGGKLLYPDRLIQHAGVAFGIGLVGHIFARAPEAADGVFGSTGTYRNYLAVTGACQMMRREVFERLGGYDERYRLTFSDVVLCMDAWNAGYRVVYTPFARLVHHESYTRQRDESAEDMVLLARHLRATGFTDDPYFHPHLDPKSPIPVVRPPFEASPQQVIADYVDRVLATVPAA